MDPIYIADGIGNRLWKAIWQFFKMVNIELLYDPAISPLGRYLREMKIYIYTKTCTKMFIAALLKIVPKWKYGQMPINERIKKMWYMHKMRYYFTIKRKESLKHATK